MCIQLSIKSHISILWMRKPRLWEVPQICPTFSHLPVRKGKFYVALHWSSPKSLIWGQLPQKKKKKSLWIHKIMITYPTNKQLLSTFYVAGSMLFSPDRCASCPSRIYMDIGRVGFRSMSGTKENQGMDCTTDLFRGLLLT